MKHKQTLRRGLGILLSLVLCLSLLPATALAEGTATETADFTTDAEAALALLNAAKTEGAANSEWDPATSTLTLKGVDFTTSAAIAVRLPDGATIVLADGTENTIANVHGLIGHSVGIQANGNITIQGSGTLTVTAGTAAQISCGIYADGNVTISGGTVTATGGETTQDTRGSNGIFAAGVTISGGTVTATGGKAATNSCGIYAYTNVTITGGTVTATGGNATGEESESYGIYGSGYFENNEVIGGNITISGGTVTAKGGTAGKYSYGICSYYGGTTISGGTVNATGDDGIYVYEGAVAIEGSELDITAGGDGIYADTYITITDSKLDITAGGDGIYASEGAVAIEGSELDISAVSYGGIYADTDITITDSELDISAVSHGIYVSESDANIEDSKLDITAVGYGIYVYEGAVTINDGTVTIRSTNTEVDDSYWALKADTITIADTLTAQASTEPDGSNPETYDSAKNDTYDWVKIEPAAGTEPEKTAAPTISYDDETLTVTASGSGIVKLYVNNTEVSNPYTFEKGDENVTYIVTATAQEDGKEVSDAATLEVTVPAKTATPDPTKYTVTVNGSYASTTGAGEYEAGETVTIYAGSRSGYSFDGWTSSDVEITNANSKTATFVMPDKAVTVTANWEKDSSGGGYVPTYYDIAVEDAAHGEVSSSRKTASSGTTVTLTVEADKGYTLETLTVTNKNGNEIALTNKGDGEYTFKMPASDVTVEATFMEDNTMLNYFMDVPTDAYYYDAVLWAVENEITNGTDAVHFSPDMTCTRAQAVTFLWRAAGSPEPETDVMPFEDVAADAYYYDAVLWAVENGITDGTSATTFSPDAVCSRAQIVTFLWRSQKSPAADSVNPFTDVAADAYYNSAVLWAVTNGITEGTSATTFSPAANCTRAQIVTFLYRCLG